jgi:hypothetical protein
VTRDDIEDEKPAAGVPAGGCRFGPVSPVSPGRAIEDVRGQSNRPSSRRHARQTCLVRDEASNVAGRASDGFGWNAHDPTRPPRELHRNESARSGKPQGREESIDAGTGRREKKRTARAAGDETPKRDRPEAGRPGQRERRQ